MSKGLDVIALALGKKYTDETVLGGGAIKGKNCTIKSIEEITGGHRITFEWTLDDGTVKTDTLDVIDGVNGTNGTNGKDGKDGRDGTDGTNGVDGKDGIGIPNGGTTGQVLKKKSNTDYDTEWQDEEGGAVDSVNGQTGAVILDAEDVGAYSTSEVDTALASKADLEDVVNNASYDSVNHLILFKNDLTTLFSLDAAAFVKDGMVNDVEITGGNLVITFNTDAGKQDISIPLTDIFDPNNYYNKTATDNLLADKADETEIADIVNVYGAKNLLPYPYYSTTKIQNGITFTDNGDGTITVNGTATDGVVFFCSIRGENGKCILPNGKYIVTGCPSGGAVNSYKIGASRISGGSGVTYGTDVGNGLTITLDGDDFGDDDVRLQIGIAVSSGTVCNNLLFKPMVRPASIKDDTYVPYVPTNKTLYEAKVSWDDASESVQKNLNSYPFADITKTVNGITFTDLGDGRIQVNGTATDDASFSCHIRAIGTAIPLFIPNGRYIISGCPSGGSSSTYMVGTAITKNGSASLVALDYGNGREFILNGDDTYTDKVQLQIQIVIKSGQTVNNLIFSPMLRKATIKDDTWQPYAMTNKELTDKLIPSVISVDRDTTTTNSATIRLYRYGSLRILTGSFNPSVAGTSVSNTHIADVPLATDRPTYTVISTCGRGETDSSHTAKIGNINVGIDGTIKYQGQATGENMFFNLSWLVGV